MQKEDYLLLFLVAFYVLDPFTYGFLFGYAVLAFLLLYFSKAIKLFDTTLLILFLFSIVYALFYSFNPGLGAQFILIYSIVPGALYLSGKWLRIRTDNIGSFWILILLGFVYSVPAIISILKFINENGFVSVKRDVPNIWTGELLSATNMASAFALNMCIPGIFIIGNKIIKYKLTYIVLTGVYLVSIICVFRLGSRTQLALSIFSVVIALIFKVSKQNLRQNFVTFVIIFIALNGLLSYFSFDTETDLLSAYADRMDSKTHGVATAGGRTNKWEKSIIYMFKEPLGWELKEFGFAHNLWFDATRVGGVISLILLLAFTLRSSKVMMRLFSLNKRISLLDGQLLLYLSCFFLSFFVEPILEGYFILFSLFCFIVGFSHSHIGKSNSRKITPNQSVI
ncbi:hypothetical protein [Sediminicola luteus]|uniref:O-antigen polymerase n=1 Tax=Sediminicola luteus TaxID=319238 RepID=A0A2A4G3P6_9FLAO|nr:hypothetical protein [Sediminicola luteus]PCE62604.1 hypothetical protein B7P33_18400 [Sediminicola luteus]